MKIVSVHPVPILDKKYSGANLLVFNYLFLDIPYEIWCLNSPGDDFELDGQKWIGSSKIGLLRKLWVESKDIKLLHLYHIRHWSLLYSIIYKRRNPGGKIFIKLDLGYHLMRNLTVIFRIFNLPILRLVDIVGYEDERIGAYPSYIYKLKKVVNGINPIEDLIGNIKKENIILLCGRFGAVQKNNELFLQALIDNDIKHLQGWKIVLLGSYTEDFVNKLEKCFEIKPLLRNIFILPGFITDAKEKYKLFCSAKIFLHTANFEGDPNIQYDAMFGGCVMVSTDVANISQNYPKEYSFFYKINDKVGLWENLLKAIHKTDNTDKQIYLNIQNHCLQNFTWEKVLSPVIGLL